MPLFAQPVVRRSDKYKIQKYGILFFSLDSQNKPSGKLLAGAWVEIIKTTTSAKSTPLEIFRAFESKYAVKVPSVSIDNNFEIIKNF